MKKNVLALSIAAMIGGLGFAGAASAGVLDTVATAADATALQLSEGGVGHMLLVPYYNVQNGNMTVLHVVNTDTVNGKAVKVRFRGAANSDDVMDFQVYMSPGDVWTAAVTADPATGVAQVQSADTTCTIPALGNNTPQLFTTGRLDSIAAPYKSDAVKANGTREGYVEIFNMADIPENTTADSLYDLTKHKNGAAPTCATATGADALWALAGKNYTDPTLAAAAGFDTPTGGLMGDWYIINVPETTTFSGAATAVVAVDGTGASARGNFVHFPQIDTAVSSISATAINDFTADPLLRTDAVDAGNTTVSAAAVAAGFYDLPDMSTPYLPADVGAPKNQAAALTSALAVTSVTNQYANDESISAKTDWVFSMPTRRYSVAANYEAVTSSAGATDSNVKYRLFSNLAPGSVTADRAAQDEWFFAGNTPIATDGSGNICVIADGQRFWDREETTPGSTTPGPVFSPRVPGRVANVALCGETSVLVFKDTGNSVLAASVARSTMTTGTYTNGWGVVNTANPVASVPVGQQGLPLMGASFIKLTNPEAAPGLSGTYGITWPHRFTR